MSRSNKIIPFNYFGGKYNHLDWIIKLLPKTKSYVEVFGGSGVVLFNREPSKIETYNDINSTVVNFFMMLREYPEELLQKIYFTPCSREEYIKCYRSMSEGNEIERARRFFVVVSQSFNGTYSRQTGWKMSTKETRATISEAVSRWISKIPNLVLIIERLRRIQILNLDFRIILEKFDNPDTLFYCDPPYLHDTRCNNNEYEHEMQQHDHIDLLNICRTIQGKVAISGYDNEIYNDLLQGFYKITAKKKFDTLFHSSRQEVLWTNYDALNHTTSLFHNEVA